MWCIAERSGNSEQSDNFYNFFNSFKTLNAHG